MLLHDRRKTRSASLFVEHAFRHVCWSMFLVIDDQWQLKHSICCSLADFDILIPTAYHTRQRHGRHKNHLAHISAACQTHLPEHVDLSVPVRFFPRVFSVNRLPCHLVVGSRRHDLRHHLSYRRQVLLCCRRETASKTEKTYVLSEL